MELSSSQHPKRARRVVAGALILFLGGMVALSFSLGTPHEAHGLTTTTVGSVTLQFPTKNLPPSHDNDAGRARSIDVTPDNDTDAWQRG
ncbi:MAG: hypothetical protein HKL85_10130 [Acidimicrobiaceae bacterium]|nr:hypothetical protein [Acidimicrobiaceae bacterium]